MSELVRTLGFNDHKLKVIDGYLGVLRELNCGETWEAMEYSPNKYGYESPYGETKKIVSEYISRIGFNEALIDKFWYYWADCLENAEYCLDLAFRSLCEGY